MEPAMLSELQTAKAIEYLLAVGFLASFVPFWRYTASRVGSPAEARATLPAPAPALAPVRYAEPSGWFRVPDGLSIHPGHAWAKSTGDGEVLVGADDFARAAIGRLSDADLPAPGTMVRQGEPAWTLRGAAGPLPMISPVDGMVVATNPKARIGALESDPYGEGWLLRVQAPRFARNARQLLSGSAARAWMEDSAKRLRAVISPDLGPALADGGVPVAGIAGEVGPEVWQRIAKEFFFVESDRGGV
jgi:glycine cleavage system H lipoate-binding protein